ncbi:MAG TPA: hypothetical protein VH302_06125 [Bryobacteraceae bacterium]|jgi:hypothetical protein|nr:hypothetical protein [Bryobacteraceae bacterium]
MLLLLGLCLTALASAVELQGIVTDWNCTENMVRNGRQKVLKQDRSCSLQKDFHRSAYGLITEDKKFYKIDPQDNDRVMQILSDSPDKDNLKVVISGDLNGNTLTIKTISLL